MAKKATIFDKAPTGNPFELGRRTVTQAGARHFANNMAATSANTERRNTFTSRDPRTAAIQAGHASNAAKKQLSDDFANHYLAAGGSAAGLPSWTPGGTPVSGSSSWIGEAVEGLYETRERLENDIQDLRAGGEAQYGERVDEIIKNRQEQLSGISSQAIGDVQAPVPPSFDLGSSSSSGPVDIEDTMKLYDEYFGEADAKAWQGANEALNSEVAGNQRAVAEMNAMSGRSAAGGGYAAGQAQAQLSAGAKRGQLAVDFYQNQQRQKQSFLQQQIALAQQNGQFDKAQDLTVFLKEMDMTLGLADIEADTSFLDSQYN